MDELDCFQEQVLGKVYFDQQEVQEGGVFIDLTQGNKSVQEYTTKFERLSQFALHMVDTEEKMIRRYDQGLILAIC